jgi:hypothetical protein
MTTACQLAYFAASSRGSVAMMNGIRLTRLIGRQRIALIRERWLATPNSDEEPEAEQYSVTRAKSDETGSGRSRRYR